MALVAVFAFAAIPTAIAAPPTLVTQVGYEQLASNFLALHLRRHDGLAVDEEGRPALATTTYAIAALVSSGYNQDQAKASALILRTAGETFIGSTDQIGDHTTALALTILSLRLTDFDPTAFPVPSGARDLVADLTSAINADGSIGTSASALGQGYALMALSAGGDPIPDAATTWLAAQPCANSGDPGFGGFGLSTGSCKDVDPDSTALAILGLLQAKADADTTIANAVAYLASIQDPSGGFASSDASVNANSSGLVVSALNAASAASISSSGSSPDINKAHEYLLSLTFRCNAGPGLAGGIAYDETAFKSVTSPLDVATQSALVASTAQGMLGLSTSVVGQRGEISGPLDSEAVCGLMGEAWSSNSPPDQGQIGQTSGGFPAWGWAIVALVIIGAIAIVLVARLRKPKKDSAGASGSDAIPEDITLEEAALEESDLVDPDAEAVTLTDENSEDSIQEDTNLVESSLEESSLEDDDPDDSSPAESSPQDLAPEGSNSEDPATEALTSVDSISEDSTPEDSTPVESTPVRPTLVRPTLTSPTRVRPISVKPTAVEPTPVESTPAESTPKESISADPAPDNPSPEPPSTPDSDEPKLPKTKGEYRYFGR